MISYYAVGTPEDGIVPSTRPPQSIPNLFTKLSDAFCPDILVDLEKFKGDNSWRRWVALVTLVASCGISIWQLQSARHSIELFLLLIVQIVEIFMLAPHLKKTPCLNGSKRWFRLSHRAVCVLITFLSAIVATYCVWSWWTASFSGRIRIIQALLSLVTFGSAGTMRRGPKALYELPTTELGFGSVADKDGDRMRSVLEFHSSSVFSAFCMSYVTQIVWQALRHERLEESEIPHLPAGNRAENLYAERKDYYKMMNGSKQVIFTEWSLCWYVWRGFMWPLAIACIGCTVDGVLSLASPWILHNLIDLFETPSHDRYAGYLWCGLMFVTMNFTNGAVAWIYTQENVDLHQPARVVIETLLYAKLLRTKNAHRRESRQLKGGEDSNGSQILNLFTNDANTIASIAAHCFNPIFKGLVTFVCGCFLLYDMLSWSAFLGLVIAAIGAPGHRAFAKWLSRINKKLYWSRDRRVTLTKELLFSIKVIKLNAWENSYLAKLGDLKQIELRYQRLQYWCYSFLNVYGRGVPLASLLIMFFNYTVVERKTLTPSTAFTALWLFDVVQSSMGQIPSAIQKYMNLRISLQRSIRFLNSPEIERTARTTAICCRGASFRWATLDEEAEDTFSLSDVNLVIKSGLTVVYGPTASGKTLLLLGLLGEVESHGQVNTPWSSSNAIPLGNDLEMTPELKSGWLNATVAYAPQTAHIRHGTVKSNILFGQVFWPERYDRVVEACSLSLTDFPDLDETEIGEGGHTISGGQRARIGLARSVYSRATTVLLDDALSAVDAITASTIIQKIQPLLEGRTTILVSHQVEICRPFAKQLLELVDGRVIAHDCEITARGLPASDPDISSPASRSLDELVDFSQALNKERPKQLVRVEHRQSGRVSVKREYGFFLKSLGAWGQFGFILVVLYCLSQFVSIVVPKVLEAWTFSLSDSTRTLRYLGLYGAVVAADLVVNLIKEAHLYNGFKRNSQAIHDKMLAALISAPLYFHDTVPKGRILNRCTDDILRIDDQLPGIVSSAIASSLNILGSTIVVAVSSPAFLLISAAITPLVVWVGKGLAKIRSETRRYSSVSQSPLNSVYVETLQSLPVIRAFGAQDAYLLTTLRLLDTYRRAGVWEYAGWNFFQFGMKSISTVVVAAVGLVLLQRKHVTASEAGFLLTFALRCSNGVVELMHVSTDLDTDMVAVERVQEYCRIEPEPDKARGFVRESPWPVHGSLTIRNLSVKYAEDLPEVLHSLNLDIKGGERIGIVGPTGHGKSTLALSIFRAVQYSGIISIDGVDISTVPLDELRNCLSMIPHDPTLMSGTLRESLDISGQHSDAEIYDALSESQLMTQERKGLFSDLETRVEPGGVNFSHGQRQLLCLARAFLKPSKVLVFDEFTSSLDYDTDTKISATLSRAFQGSTVVCIAHRLATVITFDRVLVMERGRVVEYDSPAELLKKEGAFYRLCAANGRDELERLMKWTGN